VSCPEYETAPPFWVWDQLLAQLGAGGALQARGSEPDAELARFLLFDTITAEIRQAAADRPLLLVIDDLHWADQGSRRLLAAIRGALATVPAVILGTYRDTELAGAALVAEVGGTHSHARRAGSGRAGRIGALGHWFRCPRRPADRAACTHRR